MTIVASQRLEWLKYVITIATRVIIIPIPSRANSAWDVVMARSPCHQIAGFQKPGTSGQ